MELNGALLHQISVIHASTRRLCYQDQDSPHELHGYGRMLHVLRRHPGLTQKELAEQLEIRPQSLTTALQRLEDRGLLKRVPAPLDHRQKEIFLTTEGEKAADLTHAQRLRISETVFKSLSDQEKQTLLLLLQKVSRSCRAVEKE
jgi:DNA-binding MarR family transcriptional regulator